MQDEDRALHAYNVPVVFTCLNQLINRLIHLWACTIRFSYNTGLCGNIKTTAWLIDKGSCVKCWKYKQHPLFFKTHPLFPPTLFRFIGCLESTSSSAHDLRRGIKAKKAVNVTHQTRFWIHGYWVCYFLIGSKNSRQVKHTQSKIKLGTLKHV